MKKNTILFCLSLTIAVVSVRAQNLSTDTFLNNSFLSLAGSETYGVNFGGSSQTTLNGYLFDAAPVDGGAANISYNSANNVDLGGTFGSYATGDASLNQVLSDGALLNPSGTSIVITLNNLTLGQTYNVLLFTADSRNINLTDVRTFGVSDGAASITSARYNYPNQDYPSGPFGSYVLDSFTADGVTHDITYSQPNGIQLNGLLVGAAPVPEPSSWAVLLIGIAIFSSSTRLTSRQRSKLN